MKELVVSLGIWRAVLGIQGHELPFLFEITEKSGLPVLYIHNGPERIEVNEISKRNDSLFIRLPVYDSEIHAKVNGGEMQGVWYNFSRSDNREIPFKAKHGDRARFKTENNISDFDFSGRWACRFAAEKDSSLAIGLFEQSGQKVSGTFLTPAGDYRFLEGVAEKDSLKLSCFDGAFAYLFLAKIHRGELNGIFLAGNHYKTGWKGIKNDTLQLPDPYSISRLKTGVTSLQFRFLDIDSNLVEFPSAGFSNKVVILQLSGSWCPNCVDESRYFSYFLEKNTGMPVAVIGLMFEKTTDFSKAVSNIRRFKSYTGVSYPLLYAGDRKRIKETLPELEVMGGYPTTIIIDKKGKVRKVHTGFNGPATGIHYVKQKETFERLVQELMAE